MIESFNGKTPRIAESAFVHPSAHIIGDVEIGENSSVWPGAVIRGDFGDREIGGGMRIGQNTYVEDNAVVHFSKEIGDNVIIGHGAVVEALKVGNNVLIGDNATILADSEIGDFCIIAAGAVVREGTKIPSHSFVTGVPGEIKGKVSAEQIAKTERSRSRLVPLVAAHKKQRVVWSKV